MERLDSLPFVFSSNMRTRYASRISARVLLLRTPRTSNQLGCSVHCAERSGAKK